MIHGMNEPYSFSKQLEEVTLSYRRRLTSKVKSESNVAKKVVKEYLTSSSVHGLKYIAEDGRHWSERLLWIFASVISISCCIMIILTIWEKYSTNPTTTIVDSSNYPSQKIPFPAITICDINNYDVEQLDHVVESYLQHKGDEKKEVFRKVLKVLSYIPYGAYTPYKDELHKVQSVEEIAKESVNDILFQIFRKCEDLIETCHWNDDPIDCCKEFQWDLTEFGMCFSFNSLISHSKMLREESLNQPERKLKAALRTGLSVILTPQMSEPLKQPAIRLFIHQTDDLPEETSGVTIMVNNYATLPISGTQIFADEPLRLLHVQQRNCLFSDEGSLAVNSIYSYQACVTQCRMDYVIRLCKCNPYFYPQQKNVPNCTFGDMACIERIETTLIQLKPPKENIYFQAEETDGMECKCLPGCTQTLYQITDTEIKYKEFKNIPRNRTKVDIHFRTPSIVRYKRELTFTFVDAIVSCGGIIGLFLGSSVLSSAELIYFLLFRMWSFLRMKPEKENMQRTTGNIHHTGIIQVHSIRNYPSSKMPLTTWNSWTPN